jgi:cardiolipin synthase (CMP-forming)
MADSHKSSSFMAQIPNAITLGRIVLSGAILVSLIFEQYRPAFYLFILAGLSDALDGFLARVCHWQSRFGSIADPLADKILLLSSLIAFAYNGLLPTWVVILIIMRDMWVVGGALAYHYLIGAYELSPTWMSKTNTFFQIVLVFCLLLNVGFVALPILLIHTMVYLVVLANTVSCIDYTWVWGKRAIQIITKRRA